MFREFPNLTLFEIHSLKIFEIYLLVGLLHFFTELSFQNSKIEAFYKNYKLIIVFGKFESKLSFWLQDVLINIKKIGYPSENIE